MIPMSKLVTAVTSATNVSDLINNIVEARGYTYGDIITSVKQPSEPGASSFAEGMPYHLGFNNGASDWPVYLLTGHYTIGDVAKTYLVFTVGYWASVHTALTGTITVASDDPVIGNGTERVMTKGAILAELLGYDDFMVVYHSGNKTGLIGEFPGLKWNPTYGAEPLDPPVMGPTRFLILDATIPSDSPALKAPNFFDCHDVEYDWSITSGSPRIMGFSDQWNGNVVTERLWFIPLQEYTTDTENMTDLAMLRVGALHSSLQDAAHAIAENVSKVETAILSLKGAFEDTAVFGASVRDVVNNALAVRQATSYIPRP